MKHKVTYLVLALLASVSLRAQNNTLCPSATNMGTDFWVAFIYNYHETQSYNPGQLSITCLGNQNCTVSSVGPGSTCSLPLNAANSFCVTQPLGDNGNIPVGTVFNGGFHVTSPEPIWLYACNYVRSTQDIATILPTSALGTAYIVQDYPAWEYGSQVLFLATENNTVLNFTVPCNIQGTSIVAGTTLTPTLMRGQTLLLISNGNGSSFSGMHVVSNGKPFALFQGGRRIKVPTNGSGSDLLFEQALPINLWGTEFVVAGASMQTGNNYVRITSSQDSCTITVNGTPLPTLLSAGETYELSFPTTDMRHILTSKPACVVLYLTSYVNAGNKGDPSSVIIAPVDRGVCDCRFLCSNTLEINTNSHYLCVICDTAWDSSMHLDGQPIPEGTTIGRYRVHRRPLAGNENHSGVHHLHNDNGPFTGYTYGLGYYESYAFPLGFGLNPFNAMHDTLQCLDTVCQLQQYSGYGFSISSTETSSAGTLERWRISSSGDTVHHYHLTLTVLPAADTNIFGWIVLGDTIFYNGDTLTERGDYSYHFTAANGCDSTLVLHLEYEESILTASTDGICPGDSVILNAAGTLSPWWSATPPDTSLVAQQGHTPIIVRPQQTTSYCLFSSEGGDLIDCIVVGVEPPPTLCVELSLPFIDFDSPTVYFTDCSEGGASSTWCFDDGITLNGAYSRRQFNHPLPDSVVVTLQTCNRYHCCADTTFSIHKKIRSIWWPNVFTPDEEQNNRFGCTVTYEIVAFEMHIYNRQGLLVYHTTDPSATWDGTHEGKPCPQGAYVYHWHAKYAYGYVKNGVGTVTLIR